MKPINRFKFIFLVAFVFPVILNAQTKWPKIITTKSGVKISVYQPTP
ncbi:MAG: hypothetical protein ABI723_05805 [Bacteroidia bacterium]